MRVLLTHEHQHCRVECKSNEVSFGTWIWDASKVTDEVNDEQIALVTSKNAVILYNFAKADERVISNCVEQCILYPLLKYIIALKALL